MVKIPCIEQKNGVPLPESRRRATNWAAFSKTLGLLRIKSWCWPCRSKEENRKAPYGCLPGPEPPHTPIPSLALRLVPALSLNQPYLWHRLPQPYLKWWPEKTASFQKPGPQSVESDCTYSSEGERQTDRHREIKRHRDGNSERQRQWEGDRQREKVTMCICLETGFNVAQARLKLLTGLGCPWNFLYFPSTFQSAEVIGMYQHPQVGHSISNELTKQSQLKNKIQSLVQSPRK